MWDHATTPNGVLGSKLMFNDLTGSGPRSGRPPGPMRA
jgi:hypothetical protein